MRQDSLRSLCDHSSPDGDYTDHTEDVCITKAVALFCGFETSSLVHTMYLIVHQFICLVIFFFATGILIVAK